MSARPSVRPNPEFADCVRAFEREFDYVFQALRRHGLAAADAEDVAQEVFLVMWRRWPEYDRARPLRAWLAGIAFRVAYHHRGRLGREVPGGFIDTVDEQPTPEDHASKTSARALVARVLAELPERERTLVRLHDIEDVSMRDIAEVLHIPLQTAHSRLRSGRRNFARLMRRLAMVTAARTTAADAAVLREAEVPPAPAERRRRALLRLRALAPFLPERTELPLALTGADRAPGTFHRLPLVPALVASAAIAVIAFVGLRHRSRPAVDVPAPPAVAAAVPAGPAVARAPRFQTSAAGLPLEAASSTPGAAGAAAAAAADLLGHWRFDDGPGSTVARDGSRAGNDCLLRGGPGPERWTEGVLGGAIALTGDNWLECPRVDQVARLSRELTIALWMKRTGDEGNVRALVSRQLGSRGHDHFHLGFRGEKLWLHGRGTAAGAPAAVARGRWHHVAATISADGTTRLYIDGSEAVRHQAPGRRQLGGGRNPIVIGAAFNGTGTGKPTERLRAVLDDLRLYDRALSAAELKALADHAAPLEEPRRAPEARPAASGRPFHIWLEPEGGSTTAPLAVYGDGQASGGRYIAATGGMNARRQPPPTGHTSVRFEVPGAGTFKLWGRVVAPSRSADSFWLRMDDGPWIKWNDIQPGTSWHWTEVHDDVTSQPPMFALAAGTHTLTIAYREEGARLDRLLVTNDLTYAPE